MNEVHLGIDVSKEKLDVALLIENKFKPKVFLNSEAGFNALITWLKARGAADCHICMEATGRYSHAVSRFLSDNGAHVSVVNPAQINGFAKGNLVRTKNDQSDAKVIAQYCQAFDPAPYVPPSEIEVILRERVGRIHDLKCMLKQEKGRLELVHASVEGDIKANIKSLERKIKNIMKKIAFDISKDEKQEKNRKLITSITGIADLTAYILLANIGDIDRFHSAKALAAFAGLVPKQHLSGRSVHVKTRLSKAGNREIRRALYMPALSAIIHNKIIKTFYERMISNGKTRKAAIGACMRKLLHMVYGVLQNQTPYNASI